LNSPGLDHGLRFKNNAMRGGLLEKMFFRDITIGQVTHAGITVDFNYEEGANGKYTPVLRNLQVENLKSSKSRYAMDLQGFKEAPIINVRLDNCTFDNTAEASILRNVQGLELRNVRVNGTVL
jgi:polygalacturonase